MSNAEFDLGDFSKAVQELNKGIKALNENTKASAKSASTLESIFGKGNGFKEFIKGVNKINSTGSEGIVKITKAMNSLVDSSSKLSTATSNRIQKLSNSIITLSNAAKSIDNSGIGSMNSLVNTLVRNIKTLSEIGADAIPSNHLSKIAKTFNETIVAINSAPEIKTFNDEAMVKTVNNIMKTLRLFIDGSRGLEPGIADRSVKTINAIATMVRVMDNVPISNVDMDEGEENPIIRFAKEMSDTIDILSLAIKKSESSLTEISNLTRVINAISLSFRAYVALQNMSPSQLDLNNKDNPITAFAEGMRHAILKINEASKGIEGETTYKSLNAMGNLIKTMVNVTSMPHGSIDAEANKKFFQSLISSYEFIGKGIAKVSSNIGRNENVKALSSITTAIRSITDTMPRIVEAAQSMPKFGKLQIFTQSQREMNNLFNSVEYITKKMSQIANNIKPDADPSKIKHIASALRNVTESMPRILEAARTMPRITGPLRMFSQGRRDFNNLFNTVEFITKRISRLNIKSSGANAISTISTFINELSRISQMNASGLGNLPKMFKELRKIADSIGGTRSLPSLGKLFGGKSGGGSADTAMKSLTQSTKDFGVAFNAVSATTIAKGVLMSNAVMGISNATKSLILGIANLRERTLEYFAMSTSRIQDFGRNIRDAGEQLNRMFGLQALLGSEQTTLAIESSFIIDQLGVFGGESFDIEGARDLARFIGMEYPLSAKHALDAMLDLVKAGLDLNQIYSLMPNIANLTTLSETQDIERVTRGLIAFSNVYDQFDDVIAGGFGEEQVARATDIVFQAANATTSQVDQLLDQLSRIAPLARDAGISLEEAAAMMTVFNTANIQAERGATMLMTLLYQMQSRVGRGSDTLMQLITGEVDLGLDDKFVNQALSVLRGAEFKGAGFRVIQEQMADLDTASVAVDKFMDNLRGSLLRLKGATETLIIDNLMPALEMFGRPIVDLLTNITIGIISLPEPIRTTAVNAIFLGSAFATLAGATMMAVGATMMMSGAIIKLASNMLLLIVRLPVLIFNMAVLTAGMVASVAIISTFAFAIISAGAAIEIMRGAIENNVGGIAGKLSELSDSARVFMSSFSNLAATLFRGISRIVSGQLAGMTASTISVIGSAVDVMSEKMASASSYMSLLASDTSRLVALLMPLIDATENVGNAFSYMASGIRRSIIGDPSGMADIRSGISSFMREITSIIQNTTGINMARSIFYFDSNDIKSGLSSMLRDIVSGMQSAFKDNLDAVENVALMVMSFLNPFNKISKLMKMVGLSESGEIVGQFGNMVNKTITGMVKTVIKVLDGAGLQESLEGVFGESDIVSSLFGFLNSLGEVLSEIGRVVWTIITTTADRTDAVLTSLFGVTYEMAKKIDLSTILKGLTDFVKGFNSRFIKPLSGYVNSFTELIVKMSASLMKASPMLIDIAKRIGDAISLVISSLSGGGEGGGKGFDIKNLLQSVLSGFGGIISSLGRLIDYAIGDIVRSIWQSLTTAIQTLIGGNSIGTIVGILVGELISGIVNLASSVYNAIANLFKSSDSDAEGSGESIGGALINGILNGLWDGFVLVLSNIYDFFAVIFDYISKISIEQGIIAGNEFLLNFGLAMRSGDVGYLIQSITGLLASAIRGVMSGIGGLIQSIQIPLVSPILNFIANAIGRSAGEAVKRFGDLINSVIVLFENLDIVIGLLLISLVSFLSENGIMGVVLALRKIAPAIAQVEFAIFRLRYAVTTLVNSMLPLLTTVAIFNAILFAITAVTNNLDLLRSWNIWEFLIKGAGDFVKSFFNLFGINVDWIVDPIIGALERIGYELAYQYYRFAAFVESTVPGLSMSEQSKAFRDAEESIQSVYQSPIPDLSGDEYFYDNLGFAERLSAAGSQSFMGAQVFELLKQQVEDGAKEIGDEFKNQLIDELASFPNSDRREIARIVGDMISLVTKDVMEEGVVDHDAFFSLATSLEEGGHAVSVQLVNNRDKLKTSWNQLLSDIGGFNNLTDEQISQAKKIFEGMDDIGFLYQSTGGSRRAISRLLGDPSSYETEIQRFSAFADVFNQSFNIGNANETVDAFSSYLSDTLMPEIKELIDSGDFVTPIDKLVELNMNDIISDKDLEDIVQSISTLYPESVSEGLDKAKRDITERYKEDSLIDSAVLLTSAISEASDIISSGDTFKPNFDELSNIVASGVVHYDDLGDAAKRNLNEIIDFLVEEQKLTYDQAAAYKLLTVTRKDYLNSIESDTALTSENLSKRKELADFVSEVADMSGEEIQKNLEDILATYVQLEGTMYDNVDIHQRFAEILSGLESSGELLPGTVESFERFVSAIRSADKDIDFSTVSEDFIRSRRDRFLNVFGVVDEDGKVRITPESAPAGTGGWYGDEMDFGDDESNSDKIKKARDKMAKEIEDYLDKLADKIEDYNIKRERAEEDHQRRLLEIARRSDEEFRDAIKRRDGSAAQSAMKNLRENTRTEKEDYEIRKKRDAEDHQLQLARMEEKHLKRLAEIQAEIDSLQIMHDRTMKHIEDQTEAEATRHKQEMKNITDEIKLGKERSAISQLGMNAFYSNVDKAYKSLNDLLAPVISRSGSMSGIGLNQPGSIQVGGASVRATPTLSQLLSPLSAVVDKKGSSSFKASGLPFLDTGGYIKETGLAMVHRGERVLDRERTMQYDKRNRAMYAGGGGDIYISAPIDLSNLNLQSTSVAEEVIQNIETRVGHKLVDVIRTVKGSR